MNSAYIGLGSNLGDRLAMMRAAVAALDGRLTGPAGAGASLAELAAAPGAELAVDRAGGVSALYETGPVIGAAALEKTPAAAGPATAGVARTGATVGAAAAATASGEAAEPPPTRAGQPAYLNAAVRVRTTLSAAALLGRLHAIEWLLGRVRSVPDAPRVIDLDLLLYANAVIERPGLVVPHSRLHLRRFVLEPLADVAADVIHPALGETIGVLRDRLANEAIGQWVRRMAGADWVSKS